jgi:SAM-dependent methyltransferase
MFKAYFSVFPLEKLSKDNIGFDLGCGSGRWAKIIAPQVGELHCIDPSELALDVAKRNLSEYTNCKFHLASVDDIPLKDNSCDFGYSLGVLHHVPDTQKGIQSCVQKLKPGAPFLLYLYYSLDNKPWWYRLLWKLTNVGRLLISKMPFFIRYIITQTIACIIYYPLSRLSLILEYAGLNVSSMPLSYYRKRSFYVMRTDALDRFGTKLEKRFSRKEIQSMMENAGLENIVFSENQPYWCAVGYKRRAVL